MSDPGSNGNQRPRIGLALAGGGPGGAIYEIGAIHALQDALRGVDFNRLDVYVGVSAGAFIASCLANGMTSTQLVRAIVKSEPGQHPFIPENFFTPALGEIVHRGLMTPRLAWEALSDYMLNPGDMTLVESLTRLSRALPVGIFDNEPIRQYLAHIFSIKGRTDDFRRLGRKLVVVAADLDSGEAVRFGEPPFEEVPISTAVQASTALPGLYPPVLIDDRHYVDGVLIKTLHASVALEADADVLICVNPIVPVDTNHAVSAGAMRRGKLVNRGLPTVLSQTFRTLVHSRLTVGMASYSPRFPDCQVLLIEPPRDDYQMFFTNIFSFSSRKAVCEHAYRSTLQLLRDQREKLAPAFERCGVTFRDEVLGDEDRDLWRSVGAVDPSPGSPIARRLDHTLDRLEAMLEAERSDR